MGLFKNTLVDQDMHTTMRKGINSFLTRIKTLLKFIKIPPTWRLSLVIGEKVYRDDHVHIILCYVILYYIML